MGTVRTPLAGLNTTVVGDDRINQIQEAAFAAVAYGVKEHHR
jgi:hypothetical protein